LRAASSAPGEAGRRFHPKDRRRPLWAVRRGVFWSCVVACMWQCGDALSDTRWSHHRTEPGRSEFLTDAHAQPRWVLLQGTPAAAALRCVRVRVGPPALVVQMCDRRGWLPSTAGSPRCCGTTGNGVPLWGTCDCVSGVGTSSAAPFLRDLRSAVLLRACRCSGRCGLRAVAGALWWSLEKA